MSDYEEKTIRLMAQEGGRLLSEIESLRAENDKLREENESFTSFIIKLNAEHIVRQNVESENAKLRELAQDAMKSACMGCPHKRAWRSCEGCNLYERATELGMEVDE